MGFIEDGLVTNNKQDLGQPAPNPVYALDATDWNTHMNKLLDLRTAIISGSFLGLTPSPSRPSSVTGSSGLFFWVQQTGASGSIMFYNGSQDINLTSPSGIPIVANNFPGSDIGAQINAAQEIAGSCPITVLAGNYAPTTQIILQNGSSLHFQAGVFDCSASVGVPAILCKGNNRIDCMPGAVIKETSYATLCRTTIAGYNAWLPVQDPSVDDVSNVEIVGIHFVAQNDGSEGASGNSATVDFKNAHNITVRDCFFDGTHSFAASVGGSSTSGYHADGVIMVHNRLKAIWSQGLCTENANNVIVEDNIWIDTQAIAATMIDLELNTTTDSNLWFSVSNNILNILPNTGSFTQPGAAIQINGHVFMSATLTDTYYSNAGFGRVCNNIINGGPYPVEELPQLSQGIFVTRVVNTRVEGNILNCLSNEPLYLATVRGCTVANNTLASCGTEGASITLDGAQNCNVYDNHALEENYPSTRSFPCIEEVNGNGVWNDDIPVDSDYNFIYNNHITYYPFDLNNVEFTSVAAFVSSVGPNSRVWNNNLQGMIVDDSALQNVAELSKVPFPGTRNASNPPMVRLAGLNSAGDGGAAPWIWNPSSTAVANGITVMTCSHPIPSDVTEGRWIRGLEIQQYSTTDREALALTGTDAGFVVYDTNSGSLQLWNGTGWAAVGSSNAFSFPILTGTLLLSNQLTASFVQVQQLTASNGVVSPSYVSSGPMQLTASNGAATITFGLSPRFDAPYYDLVLSNGGNLDIFTSTGDGYQLASGLLAFYIAGIAQLEMTATTLKPASNKGLNLGVNASIAWNNLYANHHAGASGSAPTLTAGSAAGTNPTISLYSNSNDAYGVINITPGASPATATAVVTASFNTAYDTPPFVTLTPANKAAASLEQGATTIGVPYVDQGSTTTGQFVVMGLGALTSGTLYQFRYSVGQ